MVIRSHALPGCAMESSQCVDRVIGPVLLDV
jgi:hypothetical protein